MKPDLLVWNTYQETKIQKPLEEPGKLVQDGKIVDQKFSICIFTFLLLTSYLNRGALDYSI